MHKEGSKTIPSIPFLPLLHGELVTSAMQLSSGKGMGPDWIPDSFFSKMRGKEDMRAKRTLLWELGKNPELIASHFVAILVLLNKNKTGVPSSKDFRPIAVQSPIQKMYELTIADELKMFNSRTSPSQYGFKPQYATAHAILGMHNFIAALPSPSRRCQGVLLIDFSKAYDSVDRGVLYERLRKIGMPEELVYKIKAIHSNSKIIINDNTVTLSKGVPQGSVLSPHLFNLFIDPLVCGLAEMDAWIWAYADDIAFGFKSQREFDIKIRLVKKFCADKGMKLNVSKCELLDLGSIRVICEFESKEVVKYLGVLIKKQGKLKNHFDMLKQRVRPIVNRIVMVASHFIPPTRLIQLFFVVVKSSVDYGSAIFTMQRKSLIEAMERFCRVSLKKILRLKASSFNIVIDQLIGNSQVEWHRRWMSVTMSPSEKKKSFVWKMLQQQRKGRVQIRKKIWWTHILLASIPKGKGLVCVLCKMQVPTEHIMVHTPSALRRIMRMVLKLRNRPFSLLELLKLDLDRLKEVWQLYRSIFNAGSI